MTDSRDILDKFLWSVKTGNYSDAIGYMQITFQDFYSRKQLLEWADSCIPFRIKLYRILGRQKRKDKTDPNVFHTYKVELVNSNGDVYYSYPNVICEVKPYKASRNGRWGVNPISVIPKGLYKEGKKIGKNYTRNIKRIKNIF
jgi:hypothetical protein